MDMRNNNLDTTKKETAVRCLEVLIPKCFITTSQNLLWTLEVYSLENGPVRKDWTLANSVVFHFMAFDWERAIKGLLEENKVPYSIVQYFTSDSVFSEANHPVAEAEGDERRHLSAVSLLQETDLRTMAALPLRRQEKRATAEAAI